MDACSVCLFWDFGKSFFMQMIFLMAGPLCANWFAAGSICPDGNVPDTNPAVPYVNGVNCGDEIKLGGGEFDWFTRLTGNTPRYMDFRIFNAPILGFKVLGFGLVTAFQPNNYLVLVNLAVCYLATIVLFFELDKRHETFMTLRRQWVFKINPPWRRNTIMLDNVPALGKLGGQTILGSGTLKSIYQGEFCVLVNTLKSIYEGDGRKSKAQAVGKAVGQSSEVATGNTDEDLYDFFAKIYDPDNIMAANFVKFCPDTADAYKDMRENELKLNTILRLNKSKLGQEEKKEEKKGGCCAKGGEKEDPEKGLSESVQQSICEG